MFPEVSIICHLKGYLDVSDKCYFYCKWNNYEIVKFDQRVHSSQAEHAFYTMISMH